MGSLAAFLDESESVLDESIGAVVRAATKRGIRVTVNDLLLYETMASTLRDLPPDPLIRQAAEWAETCGAAAVEKAAALHATAEARATRPRPLCWRRPREEAHARPMMVARMVPWFCQRVDASSEALRGHAAVLLEPHPELLRYLNV